MVDLYRVFKENQEQQVQNDVLSYLSIFAPATKHEQSNTPDWMLNMLDTTSVAGLADLALQTIMAGNQDESKVIEEQMIEKALQKDMTPDQFKQEVSQSLNQDKQMELTEKFEQAYEAKQNQLHAQPVFMPKMDNTDAPTPGMGK